MGDLWDSSEDLTSSVTNAASSYYVQETREYTSNRRGGDRDRDREDRGYRGDRGDRGDRGSRSDRGDRGGGYRRSDRQDDDCLIMHIPSDKVGKVIGRGGAKIKELQSDSGAYIKIASERDGNSDETKISISGDESSKAEAKRLIEETISDDRPPRRNDNRNDNRHDNRNDSRRYNDPPQSSRYESSQSSNGDSSRSTNYDAPRSNYDAPRSNYNAPKSTGMDFEPEGEINWQDLYQKSEKAKWDKVKDMPPIKKEFYIEDPIVARMSKREVADWRSENNDINVCQIDDSGKDIHEFKIPNPVQTFEQCFKHFPEILSEVRKQGFKKPSPIQSQAWPILMSGKDLIGIAQTGTGKTLAFLLPALIHIEKQTTPIEDRDGPNVLVLAPTRELAVQIENEVKKYHYCGIQSVCLYGGADRNAQINKVSNGVQIVIATPGRLNDLVNAGHVNLQSVTYVVLDEADRMLDMGFGPQITLSLQTVRPDRQTVMTSATWPLMVQRLALNLMSNPVRIVVGTLDLAAVNTVTQRFEFIENDEKFDQLVRFLKEMPDDDKLIVFCSKKATTVDVSSDLALMGFSKFQTIYGGLDQMDREQALEDMRNDTVNILIATDLASRGIDIEDVTHIINYDFPHNLEEFVHRVGRTGRAGKSGTAITYISRGDWSKASGLIDILKNANQEVPEQLYGMAERFNKMIERRNEEKSAFGGGGGGGYNRGGGGGGRGPPRNRDRW